MNKKFLANTAVRAAKTFCQSLAAAIGVGAAVSEVDWMSALSIAAVAAVVSILTSLASLDVISETTDSSEEVQG